VTGDKRISLSVFFPCRNEQDNIERVARQALEVLPTISDDFEVIIVDDGSTDQTGAIAERLAGENPRVRAIHHPVNRGYGGALQSGFGAATKEWVFYTDGDGQFDLHELPVFLAYLDRYDIVVGYRLRRRDPWHRRVNGWAWTRLINCLFDLHVRDIDCAFKLFRRAVFAHIELHSQGALISTEVLARARRAGYRMIEHGVHHYSRRHGRPSGASPRVIARAFYELCRLRRHILAGPQRTCANNQSKIQP